MVVRSLALAPRVRRLAAAAVNVLEVVAEQHRRRRSGAGAAEAHHAGAPLAGCR